MDYTDKRVLLKAIPENGVGEETALVLHDYNDGMLLVRVDPEFYVEEGDDGLRECSTDQIERVF
jgi:hypothetical protein